MKYTLEHIPEGEEEVIVRYRELTREVERLLQYLQESPRKLMGTKAETRVMIEITGILYIESVDGRTFVYTSEDVAQVDHSLAQLEQMLDTINFFRCSKSMILNIDKVKALRSLANNRIDATMINGEHILISRTYASEFRRRLKGGRQDD